jgi:flavin reductase (DIM6/NTAB) family NADH-FMN oxidoreductase RutF
MPTTAPEHFTPVPLNKAYRLLNHGPTVLVSAAHAGQHNVMAAAWACALDFSPPKVTVVIDKATRTRELVEGSGTFALQLPTLAMAAMTVAIGTDSAKTHPDKLQQHGVELFHAPDHAHTPLVQGCAAWLVCRVIPSPTTSRPMTCSLAKWWPRGRTSACSATGTGSSTPRPTNCARCTMWQAASFMPPGRR